MYKFVGFAMVEMVKLTLGLEPLLMSLAQVGAAMAECLKGCVEL